MQEYRLSTLAGGEQVITEHVPSVRSVAIGYWIGAGSRDEPESRAGVSHFIEHLLFKGSDRFGAQAIAEIFDALGGELNAATSRETTVVYARVPDERLETAVDVMSEMVFRPSFAELDSEREVVLEEIAMVVDNPQDHVHDLAAEAVFGGHPVGRPVIGREEVIRSVGRRAIASYHAAAYRPENVVVAAAGNLDHDALCELVAARRTGGAPGTARPRRPVTRMPRARLLFQPKETEQYHVCLGGPGVSRNDPRRFAASILDAILGGSASSRLFQEIREKRGMAYAVYSFASQYTDCGQLGVYVGTREENLAACLEIAAREIEDVAAGNVRPAELDRSKQHLEGRMLLSMESTSNRMSRLGKSLLTGTELLSLEELVEAIGDVTAGDVSALAAELLAPRNLSAAGIGPSEQRFLEAVERVNPALASRAAA